MKKRLGYAATVRDGDVAFAHHDHCAIRSFDHLLTRAHGPQALKALKPDPCENDGMGDKESYRFQRQLDQQVYNFSGSVRMSAHGFVFSGFDNPKQYNERKTRDFFRSVLTDKIEP